MRSVRWDAFTLARWGVIKWFEGRHAPLSDIFIPDAQFCARFDSNPFCRRKSHLIFLFMEKMSCDICKSQQHLIWEILHEAYFSRWLWMTFTSRYFCSLSFHSISAASFVLEHFRRLEIIIKQWFMNAN